MHKKEERGLLCQRREHASREQHPHQHTTCQLSIKHYKLNKTDEKHQVLGFSAGLLEANFVVQ